MATRRELIGLAAGAALALLTGPACAAQPTIEIVALPHWPVQNALKPVRDFLGALGARVKVVELDAESPAGEKRIKAAGLKGHVPIVLLIDGNDKFKRADGSAVEFKDFPAKADNPLGFNGAWSVADFEAAVNAALGSSMAIHWRYVGSELAYRWKRTALLIAGIALAVTLVTTLDILSRAFADLATVPFRNLGADLIVQRSAMQNAVPKQMGIILPFSAEPITTDELKRLAAEPGVSEAAGFVLLWNLGKGRFVSITGVPLGADAPALGPGKICKWLIDGRLPNAGAREVLVERHYGAFFRLAPGASVDIGGQQYAVTGVVDILEGSQIVASNFYMDIDEARRLAQLPSNLVNQVFLKLSDMAQTESIKNRIAAWLPHASVTSPGTMLQLFGGVSQTIGRFRLVAVLAGALAALALGATFVFGNLVERSRELAILRVLGWEQKQVRREIAVEMALQGLAAGLIALGLLAAGSGLLAHISVDLPASLSAENPANYAAGGFQIGASKIALPVTLTAWDWLSGPLVATLALGVCGWWMAADRKTRSLWAAIRS